MKIEINAELVLELDSKLDWINRVPHRLPAKKYYDEQFLWLDSKGNNMVMGADFSAAMDLQTYPVKVYRIKRCADVLNESPTYKD